MLGAQDMDSLQEVQVLTGNFDAQYGRSNGGQIRFVTKSGTTEFHGDFYEAIRNASFDANSWQRKSSTLASANSRPQKQNYNDFGFSFGGPLYIPGVFNRNKTKLFFFVAEEVGPTQLRKSSDRNCSYSGHARRRSQLSPQSL